MDLFNLWARISLDDSEFQSSLSDISKSSKNVKAAVQALQSPFDKVEKAVHAVAHPVQTAKAGFESLKSATETLRHPIAALKSKFDESRTSMEQQRSMLQSLGSRYEAAKKNVADLTKEYNAAVKEGGKNSDAAQELATKLFYAQGAAGSAKEAMDKYADSLNKTKKESDETSEKSGKLGDMLKSGVAAAAKAGAAAVTTAAAGIAALTKASVEGYAEYEQLVGGVETLFGDSQSTVMKYVNNAYKTAGLSANEYMETVTGFSASLLQSLDGDTEAAAQKANTAITDMADNANKMGTSMESIQNAYQGFAKGNYTMLDNLKLGYGGTKEEMERLLENAQKLSGQKYDLSSYSDIVDAIHVVQTEMHISGLTAEEAAEAVANGTMTQEEAFAAMGTTAKEASTTIEGSVNAAKSAWQNLVIGLADDTQDFDGLVDSFVESAATAGSNIIPRVQKALQGVSKLVTELAPVISEQLPVLVQTVLPGLLTTATELVSGLVSGLIAALPVLAEQAPIIITQLVTVLIENLPMLIDAAVQIIVALANGITESLPTLIPAAVEAIITIAESLIENIDTLVDAAIDLIMALAAGLIAALPILIAKAPELVASLVTAIVDNVGKLADAGWELIKELGKAIIDNVGDLLDAAGEIIDSVLQGIDDCMSQVWDMGKNIVEGLWQGIKDSWEWLKEKVKGVFESLIGVSEDTLETHSPSKVYARLGEYCAEGFDIGFTERMKTTAANMKAAFNAALGGMTPEEFDKGKTAGGIMALALATGDETLTSMLGQYSTFGELAADLERRAGMSISELYDSMVATQTADDTGTDAADITTATTTATTKTVKASSGTDVDGETKTLLRRIADKLDRIYNAISGGGLAELFDQSLGLEFALATRGDMA